MHVDANEAAGAKRWFFFAGAAAIALSYFLQQVDYRLSHSTREQVLGATLEELRGAQAAVPGRSTDPRLSAGIAGFTRPGLDEVVNPRDVMVAEHGHASDSETAHH